MPPPIPPANVIIKNFNVLSGSGLIHHSSRKLTLTIIIPRNTKPIKLARKFDVNPIRYINKMNILQAIITVRYVRKTLVIEKISLGLNSRFLFLELGDILNRTFYKNPDPKGQALVPPIRFL